MIENQNEPDAVDFSRMTKAQLLAHAEENGVDGVSDSMTKAEIIAEIKEG